MNLYTIKVKTRDGKEISLEKFKGKTLLIVNTATGCGFTPQYEALEKLYKKYHDKGFEILDFPCDQFGHQAPGTDDEIHSFCTSKYNTSFDQLKKIEVNGENEEKIFTYLKATQPFKGLGTSGLVLAPIIKKMDKDYKNNNNIKWNFTKFLIDKERKCGKQI